jgi:HSP20 family protein
MLKAEMDPFRGLRDLLRWNPLREPTPLWPEFRGSSFMPLFEVKETKDAYQFRADVPGVKDSDLEITVTGNRLTVSGNREEEKQEQTDTYYFCERSYGDFTRSFTMPDGEVDTDQIRAELKSGVLAIVVPKRPEVQPKKVTVRSSEKSMKA